MQNLVKHKSRIREYGPPADWIVWHIFPHPYGRNSPCQVSIDPPIEARSADWAQLDTADSGNRVNNARTRKNFIVVSSTPHRPISRIFPTEFSEGWRKDKIINSLKPQMIGIEANVPVRVQKLQLLLISNYWVFAVVLFWQCCHGKKPMLN